MYLPIDHRADKGFTESTTPPIPKRRWTSENFSLFFPLPSRLSYLPQYRNRDRQPPLPKPEDIGKRTRQRKKSLGLQPTLNPRYQADLYPTIKPTLVRSVPGPRTQSASIAANSISLRADIAYDVFSFWGSHPRREGNTVYGGWSRNQPRGYSKTSLPVMHACRSYRLHVQDLIITTILFLEVCASRPGPAILQYSGWTIHRFYGVFNNS
ncbi:hypothetical protein BO83DRAFT_84637 [Aspergillus eucalypticola CBS 122712]|uniref:Uncharacterized protein n=1 Tax=Aspergillus eucalypticola (strain CBS 122712 / IBT 29274) TaxID=1448314 RepID=A0A317WGV6_ASPEC|nr:uncharacterized protein BO83DRAFT_84637 [Aspergillus eucalypticola CBS 122712]PWY84288.1 hypothetical protein BO83DRAFT_84637 [Aspergillus eucalypticola CBS 122712]